MSHQRGADRPSAVLTEDDVLVMRQLHADGVRLKDIAAAFPQCSKPNIHHIIHGRRWTYLLPRCAHEARAA